MTADVEVEALVGDGSGDAADVLGVGFEHGYRVPVLTQVIGGSEAGGAGADDDSLDGH